MPKRKRGSVVYQDEEGSPFWEVESIVGCRERAAKWEYLVHWKNWDGADTWEPEDLLNSNVLPLALEFRRRHVEQYALGERAADSYGNDEKGPQQKQREENVPGDGVGDDDSKASPKAAWANRKEDDDAQQQQQQLSGAAQIQYREIERIHVRDPTAPQRVTDARLCGVPVCLVGHQGWVHFAKDWLVQEEEEQPQRTIVVPSLSPKPRHARDPESKGVPIALRNPEKDELQQRKTTAKVVLDLSSSSSLLNRWDMTLQQNKESSIPRIKPMGQSARLEEYVRKRLICYWRDGSAAKTPNKEIEWLTTRARRVHLCFLLIVIRNRMAPQ